MERYLGSFMNSCGCSYEEGQWFSCSFHCKRCYVCRTPISLSDQGLCTDCHDLKDWAKPIGLKVSVV